jgi:integrase
MTTRAVSRIAKEAMRVQGIDSPHITAHSLRHTAVTLSLVGGATVQEAQSMARHANISTTMVYAHNLEKMEAKAENAIDRLLATA